MKGRGTVRSTFYVGTFFRAPPPPPAALFPAPAHDRAPHHLQQPRDWEEREVQEVQAVQAEAGRETEQVPEK